MKKALIVDDHPFIRASVKMLLEQRGLQVVGQADNGVDAVQLVRAHAPDLVVLDIAIPRLNGFEVIDRLDLQHIATKVLILTAQPAQYFASRCLQVGASGFISKTDDLSELGNAVSAVLSGFNYFPSVTLPSVCASDQERNEIGRIARLSDRELLVLQALARGGSNKEIGDSMLLSNKTVSTYKCRLIEKLQVKSLVDLADLARRNHLI